MFIILLQHVCTIQSCQLDQHLSKNGQQCIINDCISGNDILRLTVFLGSACSFTPFLLCTPTWVHLLSTVNLSTGVLLHCTSKSLKILWVNCTYLPCGSESAVQWHTFPVLGWNAALWLVNYGQLTCIPPSKCTIQTVTLSTLPPPPSQCVINTYIV